MSWVHSLTVTMPLSPSSRIMGCCSLPAAWLSACSLERLMVTSLASQPPQAWNGRRGEMPMSGVFWHWQVLGSASRLPAQQVPSSHAPCCFTTTTTSLPVGKNLGWEGRINGKGVRQPGEACLGALPILPNRGRKCQPHPRLPCLVGKGGALSTTTLGKNALGVPNNGRISQVLNKTHQAGKEQWGSQAVRVFSRME